MKIDVRQLKARCLQPTEKLLDGQRWRLINNGGSILGVAHCDHVDCGIGDKFSRRGNVVRSTRLDDRLGVYILLDLLPSLGIKVDVLLTDDEETGQTTAQNADIDGDLYNWMVQFDRRGTGAVTYDYDCMVPFAEKYFGTVHWGSFSDISALEHLGIGGINVGTGYYQEHTPGSHAKLSEIADQVKRFVQFAKDWSEIRVPHTCRPTPDWPAMRTSWKDEGEEVDEDVPDVPDAKEWCYYDDDDPQTQRQRLRDAFNDEYDLRRMLREGKGEDW